MHIRNLSHINDMISATSEVGVLIGIENNDIGSTARQRELSEMGILEPGDETQQIESQRERIRSASYRGSGLLRSMSLTSMSMPYLDTVKTKDDVRMKYNTNCNLNPRGYEASQSLNYETNDEE